jgi:tRNA 2-thiocytidine biosynthesis protein TtcA
MILSTGRQWNRYNLAMIVPIAPTSTPKLDEATEKIQTRLCRLAGQAIADYRLIENGDKVMVCLSGGKDSYGLLDILLVLQRRAPIHFDLIAVNLDQRQPGFPEHVLPQYLARRGIPFHIESRDTYSIVKRLIPAGQTTCALCSRLRRGHLYRIATELGATKIALGHHRDDIIETLFLNLFYTGKLKAMPPKLRSRNGRHVVIRPLALVKETDLARYAELRGFPIIPCDLCGSQEDLKRKKVKAFLQQWERESPGCSDSIAAALGNVAPSLLMDSRLFDFTSVTAAAENQTEDDAWLDEAPTAPHQT